MSQGGIFEGVEPGGTKGWSLTLGEVGGVFWGPLMSVRL